MHGCGKPMDLPQEPEATGTGELAYTLKYSPWTGVGHLGDLTLVEGTLYAVQDSARVEAWYSDNDVPRPNAERAIPPTTQDGAPLREPVRVCAGASGTLWVAYRKPRPTIVQWRIDVKPPDRVGLDSSVVRLDSTVVLGGLAADPDSFFVYVADVAGDVVTKYRPSAAGGRRIAHLATGGTGDRFVREPHGLYLFGDSLLVADTGNNRIQVLSADVPLAGRGEVLGPPDARLVLRGPLDVWVDGAGVFYVADTGASRVVQLRSSGAVKEVVTEFDAAAARAPNTLVADEIQVWVADPDAGRLSIYWINTGGEDLP
jgi:hypothetical protein